VFHRDYFGPGDCLRIPFYSETSLIYRRTLARPATFSGIGIHGGEICTGVAHPAEWGNGITFSVSGSAPIQASVAHAQPANRATILAADGVRVVTPEHLMAATAGLGITDIHFELSTPELPILDGSAAEFVRLFIEAGFRESDEPAPNIRILHPISVTQGDARLIALPSEMLRYTMVIEYPDHFIGTQIYDFEFSIDGFINQVAPARTYGFQAEVEALLKRGLGQGGSLDNAVVIGDSDYLNPLRFPDELARHKLLDMIGDLALTGSVLRGHFIGIKSGHDLNRRMADAVTGA
ncbi:UDP-3-O-[3-hydroxymyristoyl] N-acetylglucosamine deacetylase, partial [bacterium]|nr:UDP-3-O-[3-hydroxymyristoyl] N-acetylglucosamine deacetylase [bacterium]